MICLYFLTSFILQRAYDVMITCNQVESVTNQMEEMRREYDSKLDRLARLLDARAARIKVILFIIIIFTTPNKALLMWYY